MKQGSFLVEMCNQGDSILYIVRAVNGQIVKICLSYDDFVNYIIDCENKLLSKSEVKNGKA